MLWMYSVYDKAVGAFMQPFFVRASGEAVRTFNDAVNDPNSPFAKHPGDFELWSIGVFDPANGCVEGNGVVRVIGALDVVNKM